MAQRSRTTKTSSTARRNARTLRPSGKRAAGPVRKAPARAGKAAAKAPARTAPKRAVDTKGAKAKPAGKAAPSSAAAALGRPGARASAVASVTPFLWFDDDFRTAAEFYVSLFPGARITGLHAMGGSFNIAGQEFMGLNGGPQYKFTPAVSFFVVCRDQAEVDRLWAALEKGGKPSRCGWIDDKFGLTWQIVPKRFLELTADPDPKKVGAVFQAMMGMVKMDVKGLEAAYNAA